MSALQDARTGDLQAFQQLVRQYQAEVFELALQLTGKHSDASEVAQEAFVLLSAAIARISSHAHLRHWLLRAVAQRAVDRPGHPLEENEPSARVPVPGEDFTSRVMARVELRWSHRRPDFAPGSAPRRQGLRTLVIPACVAAVLGAAVMLALWVSGQVQRPLSTMVTRPEATTAGNVPPNAAASETQAAPATASAPTNLARTPDFSPQYTVIVLPPRHASLDSNAIAPVEAFHSALVAELRRIPGVSLLIPGITAPPDALRPADYLLAVASLEARTLASGGTAFRIADSRGAGSLSTGSQPPGRHWPVEIRVQPVAASPSQSPGFSSVLQISEDGASLSQLAAKQIEMLRVRVFPDALIKQQLMARVRDPTLPAAERTSALDDLLGTRERGPALDAVDIGVIVAGAAAMPAADRARLWRNLRGAAHAELVETLLDSMRRDADTQVRFEALATLAADYSADARVRAAIESVSREDPAEVMRMAARRVRSGDTEWRRYLVTTLADTTLPHADRLAPLLLARESASTPGETLGLRSIMNDEEVTGALAGIVRDSWFDYTQAQTVGDALDLMANAGSAAASGLLVEIPPDNPRSGAVAAAMPAPQISPAAMSWLQKNRNNPRARRILEDIARGRADPQVGFMIEQMMQQRPPPRRPD